MKLNTKNSTFGKFFSIIFLLLSIFFFLNNSNLFKIFLIISITFALISFLIPDLFMFLNKIWEKFGVILHFIISNILIFFIYYVIFFIIGISMRLIGFDPLKKKEFFKNNTHWKVRKRQPNSFNDMF